MKAIDAAVAHAKQLRTSWVGMKPNSQVAEYAHEIEAVLDGLVQKFETEQAKLLAAEKPEPAKKVEK